MLVNIIPNLVWSADHMKIRDMTLWKNIDSIILQISDQFTST